VVYVSTFLEEGMNTWVIIPAYNESQHIYQLVREIKSLSLPVMVVDDGSSDTTYKEAERAAADILLRSETNRGKGAALDMGIRYLLGHTNLEALIIMDADLQHLTEEIEVFLKKLEEGSDFIVGNRMQNPMGMPLLRLWTNKFMSLLISRICRQKIVDSQCGFKAIKREVLEKIRLETRRYEVDSEIILQACKQGYTIESVPISSVYHRKQNSRINPIRDSWRFFLFLWRSRYGL